MANAKTLLELLNTLGKETRDVSITDMANSIVTMSAMLEAQSKKDTTAAATKAVNDALVSALYNKYEDGIIVFAEQYIDETGLDGATLIANDKIYVAIADNMPEIEYVRFGGETLTPDNRTLTLDIGNGAKLTYNAWFVKDGTLYVAVPALYAITDFTTGVATVVAGGLSYNVNVVEVPETAPVLSISNAYGIVDEEAGTTTDASIKNKAIGVEPDSLGVVLTVVNNGTAVVENAYRFTDGLNGELLGSATFGDGVYTFLRKDDYVGDYDLIFVTLGDFSFSVSNDVVYSGSVNGVSTVKLAAAVNAAFEEADEVEVDVVEDVDTDEVITVPTGKTAVVNIASGVTVTNASNSASTPTIVNNGNLTISGDGVFDNVALNGITLQTKPGSFTRITGGHFTRSDDREGNSNYVIQNYGTMIIDDIYVDLSEYHDGSFASAVENGYYNGNLKPADAEEPTMVINGGTFIGGNTTVKNDDYGHLTINGGKFVNYFGGAVLNPNEAVINGGTFEAHGRWLIVNDKYDDKMDKGNLTIKGGTFTADDNTAVFGSVAVNASAIKGNIQVSGGTWNKEVAEDALADGYVYNPNSKRVITG